MAKKAPKSAPFPVGEWKQPEYEITDHRGRKIRIVPTVPDLGRSHPGSLLLHALGLTEKEVGDHVSDIQLRGWPAIADLLAGSR